MQTKEGNLSEITREQINEAVAIVQEIAAEAQKIKDPSQGMALARRMEQAAARLGALAAGYEAQEAAKLPPEAQTPQLTRVRVKLTDEQRQRVLGEVGLDLEEVELVGSRGVWVRTLRSSSPQRMNKAILKAARKVKAEQDARDKAEQTLAQLDAVADPRLKAQLDKARKDPNFLGGLLQKAGGKGP